MTLSRQVGELAAELAKLKSEASKCRFVRIRRVRVRIGRNVFYPSSALTHNALPRRETLPAMSRKIKAGKATLDRLQLEASRLPTMSQESPICYRLYKERDALHSQLCELEAAAAVKDDDQHPHLVL